MKTEGRGTFELAGMDRPQGRAEYSCSPAMHLAGSEMKRLIMRSFIVLLYILMQVAACIAQTTTDAKFNGFLGTYHPVNGTAHGGWGWKEGDLMQQAFNFGQNAVLVKGSHAGYTFEQNITNSCSEWDVNKVYGILLPPSEFGVVNQPKDFDLWKVFEKQPGMIQGMHRFSELSKRCPQIDGVIIDDLYNDFPKAITLEELRDMKAALSGKRIDESGRVDHASLATTPSLKLYFVVYEHHLNITPPKEVLDLIDGVCFWMWKQTDHFKNFDDYIKTVHRLYPGKHVIAGVYVRHSRETPTVASVHHIMERAIDMYSEGEITGLLIFSAVWLAQKDCTRERWDELALPTFLARNYYAFLGEGRGRVIDAKTRKPIVNALVSVTRTVNGRTQEVTRKFTNEQGEYRFGGWTGRNARERLAYDINIPGGADRSVSTKAKLTAGKTIAIKDARVHRSE